MTDFDFNWKRYHDALAIANRRSKELVFDALRDAGLTLVTVDFDGEGDSGQINDITAFVGDQITPLPNTEVDMHSADFGHPEITTDRKALADAIENLCYGYLEQEHGGWENNDGAYGEFTFDVAERKIELDFNARFTDSISSSHTW
jgi:hypothetical protein